MVAEDVVTHLILQQSTFLITKKQDDEVTIAKMKTWQANANEELNDFYGHP
jgi:hypothetical protein